jgi:hypothetical protein
MHLERKLIVSKRSLAIAPRQVLRNLRQPASHLSRSAPSSQAARPCPDGYPCLVNVGLLGGTMQWCIIATANEKIDTSDLGFVCSTSQCITLGNWSERDICFMYAAYYSYELLVESMNVNVMNE